MWPKANASTAGRFFFDRRCRTIFPFDRFFFRRFVFSNDDLVPERSQGSAVGREGFEQVKVCPSPRRRRADRPGSVNLLLWSGQIEFGGVLNAKDDVLRGDPLLGGVAMGLKDFSRVVFRSRKTGRRPWFRRDRRRPPGC